MRRLHNPAIFLAALLQVLPVCRTIITNPATVSTFAIILRWTVGATAAAGAVDAVSGATSVFTSPSTFSGTVGTPFTNNVTVSIGGGNTASSSDYFVVSSGTTSSPPLTNHQSTTIGMPPGLAFTASWINNSSTIGGYIAGTPTAAGAYSATIMVVSPGNASLSQAIIITISNSATPSAPVIITPPAGTNIIAGQNAAFSVNASGAAPLGYFWLKNNAPLANAGNVSGASTATLTVTGVSATDAGNYSVLVSNAVGTATSAAAALAVISPPLISSQPLSQTNNAGTNANFSVSASGTAPLSYRWLKNSAAITNGAKFSGVSSNILTVLNLATNDAGNYSVVITNLAGSVTGSIAALAVNVPVSIIAPSITSQPVSVATYAGSNATFSVTASGTAPLTYHWLKNNSPLLNGGRIAGAGTNVLTISTLTTNDAGIYSVVVTNLAGSVTSLNATLTVNTLGSAIAPIITLQPASVTAARGSNATFSVTATGTAPLAYRWLKNNSPLFNSGNIAGANTNVLTISTLTTNDAGIYSVAVTNAAGSVVSSNATLTVSVPPAAIAPAIITQPTNVGTLVGGSATFNVAATGTAPLAYHWLKNNSPLTNGVNITGAASNVLTISTLTTNDAGVYSVVVTNIAGTVISSNAVLASYVLPVVTNGFGGLTGFYFSNNIVVSLGTGNTASSSDYFYLSAGSVTSGLVTNGQTTTVALPPGLTFKAFWVNNSPTVSGTIYGTPTTPGNYPITFYVVSPGNVPITQNITIVINDPSLPAAPSIISPVAHIAATAGGTTNLTVQVSGAAPMSYQWYFNTNTLLQNATNNSLVLKNIRVAQAGSYFVTVINQAGASTSPPVLLSVIAPPSPGIQSPSVTGKIFQFTFNPAVGLTNSVMTSGSVVGGSWTVMTNVPPPATTNAVTVSDVIGRTNRFYRVQIIP